MTRMGAERRFTAVALLAVMMFVGGTGLCEEAASTTLHITPKIGVSMYTGLAGVEVQWSHVAITAGYFPNPDARPLGLKYYFRPDGSSWYLGGFVAADAYGGGGGYRWWSSRYSFSLGTGIMDIDNGANIDGLLPLIDMGFGVSF
ncbi:MAG: hypothetical protein HQ523_05850 [Lentisphaerae bacterium]|nr:hypothetical protein [Lentisphaerota bacterium]